MTGWHPALTAAAAHGLPGSSASDDIDVAEGDVARVVADARTHKVLGLLDQALADGAVKGGDVLARAVATAVVDVAGWALLVERQHLEVGALLDAAGVEHRFLKGASVAHRFYPHPGLRSFIDVDVLVPGARLDEARGALEAAGLEPAPDLRPGFLGRFGKSLPHRSARGVEVDLHRVLAAPPFGLVASPQVLWERPQARFELGGVELPTLDPVAAFVHACVHEATSPRPRLGPLRDVAQIGVHVEDRLDDIEALSAALGVRVCVADAVASARQHLGPPESALLARTAGWGIAPTERHRLASYHGGTFQQVWAGAGAVHGVRAKLAYTAAVAFPSREMAERRGGRARRLVHALRVARARRGS